MNSHELSLRDKNIVLIGFMGVGKTTIGKLVVKESSRHLLDEEEIIKIEFGVMTLEKIKKYGEKTFRDKEREIITNLCSEQKLHIISLGGGAFIQDDIRTVCLEKSIVVYLDMSWENWKDRIALIIDSRPVLHGRSMEEIEELFYKRKEYYADHHLKVETDGKEPIEVANQIIDSLELSWESN